VWILGWWRWLVGYVLFRAQGGLCERFMKQVSEDGVRLWDVHPSAEGFTAICRAKDYRRLRPAAARTGTRVRHLRQCGAYVRLRPVMRRSGVLVGALVAMVVYLMLGGRIWVIDLPPCEPALEAGIERCLARSQVRLGAPIRDVDVEQVRMEAVADLPQIHSLSVYFEGCIAHVDIRLQEDQPKAPDTSPANVVAAVDGQILSARVTAGQSMMQVGEAVVEGELLVCGAVETEQETLFRHAAATVIARTERTVTVSASRREWIPAAGRRYDQPTLCFLTGRLPLYSPVGSTDGCVQTGQERWWRLFGVTLPVGTEWTVYTEIVDREVQYTDEQVVAIARLRADAALAAQNGAAVIGRTEEEGYWNGDTYTLTVRYTCEEDIARTVPLLTDQA